MNETVRNRIETIYNKPVGIKDNEIYFLNDTFDYQDGFKGATGFSLRPLTRIEVEDLNNDNNAIEYYRDIWVETVAIGKTDQGLEDFASDCIDNQDGDYPGHDTSYYEHYEEAKKHFNFNVESFQCGSGGRCFNKDLLNSFDKVIDQKLIDIIRNFEDA
jgi:hypothetical protein